MENRQDNNFDLLQNKHQIIGSKRMIQPIGYQTKKKYIDLFCSYDNRESV